MLIRLTPNAPIASMVLMANTQTSNQALTADTITNDQIHELRLAVRAERGALNMRTTTYDQFVKLDHAEHQCRVALGEKRAHRGFCRADARERCAEILNERARDIEILNARAL